MKKIVLLLTTMIALLCNVFAQRFCGSQLNLTEIQQTDPERYQRIMDIENQLQQVRFEVMSNVPTSTIIIPVVVHIVHNNNAQNISDAQIHAQIRVLNEDFRRQNADRVNTPNAFIGVAGDANIEFRLARIDPNGNPTSGITRTLTSVSGFCHIMDNVKFTNLGGRDAWNTQRYLNIWVCNFSLPGLMGYAQFPFDLATRPNTDGVVVGYQFFGVGNPRQPRFNRGRTLTHEVGHWLNLRHIWGDALNCTATDFVDDTPNQFGPTNGCRTFPARDQCTPTGNGVMFMNFMDYSDDACMNMFTSGQIARMRALFDTENGIRREMLVLSEFITNPPTIFGPTVFCMQATFDLHNGQATSWTLSDNVNFRVVSTNPTRAFVDAVNPMTNNFTTRLSAMYHGTEIASVYITSFCDLSPCDCPPGWCECGVPICPFCGRWGCPMCATVRSHPNPVSDILTIDLTQRETDVFSKTRTTVETETIFNIHLLNVHGMVVRQQRTQASTIQFDVSNLPEGTYYLHIEHNGEIEKHQIIINRN